jgi:hypothetical protein
MYTLGGLVVSSDDDMRPYALMEESPESLRIHEVSRGRLHRAGQEHFVHKSFDILSAFKDVLGKPVSEIPENYERGEWLVDTAMDLETNATKGLARGDARGGLVGHSESAEVRRERKWDNRPCALGHRRPLGRPHT